MSDFDKEAEREKLREKYGDEDEERAATQQMSELLLQGATMTNMHCDNCGDPVFRHQGTEFCPTCGTERGEDGTAKEATGQGGAATQQSEASTASAERPEGGAATARSDGADADADQGAETTHEQSSGAAPDRQTNAGVTGGSPDRTPASTDRSASAPTGDETPSGSASAPGEETGGQRPPTADADGTASTPDRRPGAATGTTGEGIGAAQASLARTVERFARQAETTDDPRAAREHLAAAREAAEALSALRR